MKNLLAAFAVISQIFILVLLLFFHGATIYTDHLFLALAINSVLQLIVLTPFDQFVVYFNRIKVKTNNLAAENFYLKVILLAVLMGFGISLLIAGVLFFVETYSLTESDRINQFIDAGVINGFILALPAYALTALNDRYFNAKGQIIKSYFLVLIPSFALLLGVAIWVLVSNSHIEVVGYAFALILWCGALVSTSYILKNITISLPCYLCGLKEFMVNSFVMRVGHNIYAISFQLITNSILIGMPEGVLTVFNYAHRSIIAIFTVAVGPSNRVFMYDLAKHSHSLKSDQFINYKTIYLKESLVLFITLSFLLLAGAFAFDWLNTIYDVISLGFSLTDYMEILIVLMFWQTIVIMESIYVGLIITMAVGRMFIIVNTAFAGMFFFLTWLVSDYNNIIYFIFCGVVSQVVSYLLYRRYASRLMVEKGFNECES